MTTTTDVHWTDRLSTVENRRRAGIALLVVAAVGLLASVIGTVVAWRLVGTVNDATVDTLSVTIEALDSVQDTIDVADGTVGSTADALSDLEATLVTLSGALESGADVIDDTARLTETSGPALTDAASTLRQLEGVGGQVDGFLTTLSNLPLSPDFDPAAGLGATFGRLADDIEPLDDEFAATAASLQNFEGSLALLQTDVDQLAVTVGEVNGELVAGERLLDQYRANVEEAQTVARQSQTDLVRDQTMLRVVILVLGLNFALAQAAPLWLGLQLTDRLVRRNENEPISSNTTPETV